MTNQKHYNTKLVLSIILQLALLCIGHIMNNRLIVIAALSVFEAILLFSRRSDIFPIMLFYLSWSPVLKQNPGESTVYSLSILLIAGLIIVEWLKKESSIYAISLLLSILLIIFSLVVKICYGYPWHTKYISICIMLIVFPIYIDIHKMDISFKRAANFMIAGVLISFVAADYLLKFPQMMQYIEMFEYDNVGLVRNCGFYGDPNFLASQSLVAISSCFILMKNYKSTFYLISRLIVIAVLVFYGFSSVSKMFILCVVLILLIGFVELLFEKRNLSSKLGIITAAIIIVLVIVVGNVFDQQIQYYLIRMDLIERGQSVTSGRFDLTLSYLSYIGENIPVLLFGKGLSRVLLSHGSHSTLIQAIYQLGLIGTGILFAWIVNVYRIINMGTNNKLAYGSLMILIIGFIFPWLSLDMLYYDGFFYLLLLFLFGIKYLVEQEKAI